MLHHQFFYQAVNYGGKSVARAVPIASNSPAQDDQFVLPSTLALTDLSQLNAAVLTAMAAKPEMPLTAWAHLVVAHGSPQNMPYDTVVWFAVAEAVIRQTKQRQQSHESYANLQPWRDWLRAQPFEYDQSHEGVSKLFADCHTGRDAFQILSDINTPELVTAILNVLDAETPVDPTGVSHSSTSLRPLLNVSTSKQGTLISYRTTHMNYVDPVLDEDEVAPVATPEDLLNPEQRKEAHATTCMGQLQQHAEKGWVLRNTTKNEVATLWLDQQLLAFRNNANPNIEKLATTLEQGVAFGIPESQILASELNRIDTPGSMVAKKICEIVLKQPWSSIDTQISVLTGLGYQKELPYYLWLYFKDNQNEHHVFDLPSL